MENYWYADYVFVIFAFSCFGLVFVVRAIFVWTWKMVSLSFCYLFYQPMDEMIKTWTLLFPTKENPNCSIGQWCCSMTSKQIIDYFLKSSRAWRFFNRAFAQPTKSHVRLCPSYKPIKWLYFPLFVVCVLFARFHFKVIRKSLDLVGFVVVIVFVVVFIQELA